MIADQVIALNRGVDVLCQLGRSAPVEEDSVTRLTDPLEVDASRPASTTMSASVVVAPSGGPSAPKKGFSSFSVDSLLSDRRQSQAADLSMQRPVTPPRPPAPVHSEDEDKSFDSDADCDADDDDCDVDIEDDASSGGKQTPPMSHGGISVAGSPGAGHAFHLSAAAAAAAAAAAGAFQSGGAALHLPAHLAMQMRGAALGAPFTAGVAPPGWPLGPYGLAAAAWAQHASQFVTSKFTDALISLT